MFRYPGGKNKLKKKIVSIIKKFYGNERDIFSNTFDHIYAEPFLGSGEVLIELINDISLDNIFLNDYDIGISCFWSSVVRHDKELCRLIKSFTPTVDNFYKLKSFFKNTELRSNINKINIPEIGMFKAALHQISYSGLGVMSGGPLGGKSQESDYKIDCRWSSKYLCKKIKKYNNILKNNVINNDGCDCLDFEDVFKKIDSKKVFYYLDPPYFKKGPELYQYSFNPEDHKRLAICLKNTSNPWLLSYDDTKEIRDLYNWANIKEVEINYTINTKQKGSLLKKELLITPIKYSFLIEDIEKVNKNEVK